MDLRRTVMTRNHPRKNPAAVSLGRRGGSSTSPAKSAAARANGAKGGRPPRFDRDDVREAFDRVVARMDDRGESLDEAIEAVAQGNPNRRGTFAFAVKQFATS
jgi:hypothetical protein